MQVVPQTRARKTEPVSEFSKESAVNLRPGTTVAVVAYNHSEFIVECLESIRTQSRCATRVLIADDNSPDNTQDVIKEYCNRYPDFAEFYPNTVNIGLNRTLNRLLELTTTEFFTYISADDFMLPQRLEIQEELLRKYPDTALCYSDAIVVDAASQESTDPSSVEFPWPDDEEILAKPFRQLLTKNWIPAASIFLRTNLLKESGGYHQDIFFEDHEILVRLSKHYNFCFTRNPLVAVRRLSTSLGATGIAHKSPRFIEAQNEIYSHYASADRELSLKSYSLRWELAKRSISTEMSRRESLRLLWSSRNGAEKKLAFPYQLIRLAASVIRK